MRSLAESLELPPVLPMAYSVADAHAVLSILGAEHERLRPYDGDFNAPWLLNGFDDPLWHTANRGREEYIEGRWHRAINIDWNVLLPSGAHLTDPAYGRLLAALKRLSVLRRSGFLGRIPSVSTWRSEVLEWLGLARWLVLHESRYQPANHAFALLDQNGMNELLGHIAQGGWTCALQIPERLLASWYESAYGEPCAPCVLEKPYAVPDEVRGRLCEWLAEQNYYCKVQSGAYRGRQRLNVHRLAREVHAPVSLLRGSEGVRLFCRQFEPDFSVSTLLLSTEQRTEYPAHLVPLREALASKAGTPHAAKLTRLALETLLSAHRHLPTDLPDPVGLSLRTSFYLAKRPTTSGHHEFIPIDLGLIYLNEAMRWVHTYGEPIVEYYLEFLSNLDVSRLRKLRRTRRLWEIRRVFATVDGTRHKVKGLEISGLARSGWASTVDIAATRAAPSLTDAVNVLIGACIVCIAILKPSREAELLHLPRECLREGHDGYYLRFELGKSNVGEAYPWRDKPIPKITAQAIRLLQRLGGGAAAVLGTKHKHQQKLFCLPWARVGHTRVPTTTMLNCYLDLFCDQVGLAPDALGRRWYVRVHEMRKWFLLLLFWAGRFDVLDAVRWIAGHIRADHTYAYIEENFPGEELPAIEAEYSIDRLRHLDQVKRVAPRESSSVSENSPGLEALYSQVCQHFNVAALVLVPEPEWTEYVTQLRAQSGFSLHPQTLYAHDGKQVVGLTVSFVLAKESV
jgi:hypothetical protein